MFASVALLLLAVPPASAVTVSPVQKVLTMMNDMKTKGIAEKDSEIATFKTFMQFCKDTMASKEKSVTDTADEIEKLSADIGMYNAEAKVLGKEITKLDASADDTKNEMAKSKAQFEVEKSDYQDTHAEYETNIADIEVGTSQLKSMMSALDGASQGNAMSLVQKMVAKARLPESAVQVLRSFIEKSSRTRSEDDLSAPEGNKFESQSGGVVEMMERLTERLEDQKTTLEQEFVKARGAYQMTQQTLTDQLDRDLTLRNHKTGAKKQKENSAAAAEGDKASSETSKATDEGFLKDLYSECAAKSSEYETNQKIRAGEVAALNKAIGIISGGAVSGASETHLPQLLQKSSSLVQLRSSVNKRKSQTVAASFLQAQGKSLQSRVLTAISLRVAEDPFAKVKKMVQDMVDRLMEEANEEAEHKGFCDTELSTNQQTREEKTTKVSELSATIEGNTARMGILSNEIAELGEQIADIDTSVKEALAIRADEKAKNNKTVLEAVAASTAVRQALDVLQDYYDGVSLVQKAAVKRAPVTQGGSATGVMGMLEVIRSDFNRLESDTKATEQANQKQFERFSTDSAQEKAVKETHSKNKSETRTETDVATAALKKNLKSTQEELNAADLYFEKLKPSCVEAGVSYDDRVNRRKEEIESLAEALKILDEQDLA